MNRDDRTKNDSILDLVITNKDNWVSNMEIGGKLGSSDHQEIRFKIKWNIKLPPNQVQVPGFGRVNYDGLGKYLDQLCQVRDWEGVALKGMEKSGKK